MGNYQTRESGGVDGVGEVAPTHDGGVPGAGHVTRPAPISVHCICVSTEAVGPALQASELVALKHNTHDETCRTENTWSLD